MHGYRPHSRVCESASGPRAFLKKTGTIKKFRGRIKTGSTSKASSSQLPYWFKGEICRDLSASKHFPHKPSSLVVVRRFVEPLVGCQDVSAYVEASKGHSIVRMKRWKHLISYFVLWRCCTIAHLMADGAAPAGVRRGLTSALHPARSGSLHINTA
jgi:hypothetical protein